MRQQGCIGARSAQFHPASSSDAIFVKQFARFGSAIITGDWLISIHGTIGGVHYGGTIDAPDYYSNQEAYTWFDRFFPIGPGTSASIISSDIEAANVRRSLPSGYTSVNYQKVTDTFKLMAGRSYSFKAAMRVTNSNYIGYLSLFPNNVARTAATSTTETSLSASYTPAATREDYYFAAMIQYVGPISWLSEVYDASSDACRTYMNNGNYEPVYQRASSKPSLPTGTTAASPGNGWSTSIPDDNGTLWVAFGRMTNRDASAKLIVSSIQFTCTDNDMFIPNYAVDLRTGKTYQQDAYVKGELYADKGEFTNVKVSGGLRSPFTYINKGEEFTNDFSDNLAIYSSVDDDATYEIPWDASQSGRKIVVANYKWGSGQQLASGKVKIKAKTGMYFYEYGIQKEEITLSREVVELIGYGDSSNFYGWIVLTRTDLGTQSSYGRPLKVLAMGTIIIKGKTNNDISGLITTFDGSVMQVARNDVGKYTVSFGASWFQEDIECFVMVAGYGMCLNTNNPVYANLHSKDKSGFTVWTGDDASLNDGSFSFMVTNFCDDNNHIFGRD